MHIFVVTGRVHGGKTTFVGELVEALKEKDLRVSGFLSRGTFRDGRRDSFFLEDLAEGTEIPLATLDPREGWFRYRRFYFNPIALEKGTEMVTGRSGLASDLIVVDEVGPLELQGMGWYSLLREVAAMDTIPQVWVAGDRVVDDVMEKWGIAPENVVRADTGIEHDAREELLGLLMEKIVKFNPLH